MKHWFVALSFLSALLFSTCNSTSEQTTKANYFNLREYFDGEAARLQAANPIIQKTVSIGDSEEEKHLNIESWITELSAFTDADINKTAWNGMYTVEKNDHMERYKANADDLPVQLLLIKKQDKKIKGVEISIKKENTLYASAEQLNYYADSLYEIKKTQAVRLTDLKIYRVKGIFTNAQKQPSMQTPTAPLP